MSLRIAFLIPTLDPGGAERQLVNTVRALAEHDIHIAVFVMRDAHTLSPQLPDTVQLEVIGIKGKGSFGEFRRLFNKISAFKPDVLHGQLYPGNLIARLYRLTRPKTKVVNHIHGLGGWMKPWNIWGERLTGWLADRILTVSQRSYDIRRRREGYSLKRLAVQYNAIDTRRFDGPLPAAQPPLIFGMAARLIPLKRVDRVIRLIGALRERGLDAQLYIAGDGPERANLDALVEELQLSQAIHFQGLVSEMPAFYQSIHVLCLASETEDLPMVLIEAMASGRPFIASDVGGISELTAEGIGLLVPDWEAADFPDQVHDFIASVDWEACWKHNREVAQTQFDERAYAQRLLEMYRGFFIDN
ncbi:MAG: glycosyltransferase [Bacteroidia bacterium]